MSRRRRPSGRPPRTRFASPRVARVLRGWGAACLLGLAACGSSEQATPTAPSPTEPRAGSQAPPAGPVAEAPAGDVAAAGPADAACASVIVVAFQGATHAPASVTRTEAEARARAEDLLRRLEAGEAFGAVAREASDAASSGPRGGLLGTYALDAWPAAHAPIRDAVWALRVGETSEVLRAPYGWVVARRCPVEWVHTRHVLVRFAGARNAGPEITRSRDEARIAAHALWNELQAPGADFGALARARSEDASAARGGDLGVTGRGGLAEAYEVEAYALSPGGISLPVETEFGFHLIQRLPD